MGLPVTTGRKQLEDRLVNRDGAARGKVIPVLPTKKYGLRGR